MRVPSPRAGPRARWPATSSTGRRTSPDKSETCRASTAPPWRTDEPRTAKGQGVRGLVRHALRRFRPADAVPAPGHRCRELLGRGRGGRADGQRPRRPADDGRHRGGGRLPRTAAAAARHGPCVECYRSGEPVHVTDLASERRWPEFTPTALEFGYRSLHTVPLRLHERVLGALNVFRREAGDLSDADEQVAQAMADVATLALLHWSREPTGEEEVVTRVQSALAAKVMLETAKGMVAQYAGVSIAEASRMLRAYALRHRVRPSDTALALTTRTLDLADVTAPVDEDAPDAPAR
ncbi:GAF and ANTAR domain-containing protein [Streptomyces sp. NPDC051133]|uniref:GAF and ANTAR domain-containing protein n=1 Tax=Streptomyces sp. NPDC051133 TaxID=3155521 RepID=UPI0034340CF7